MLVDFTSIAGNVASSSVGGIGNLGTSLLSLDGSTLRGNQALTAGDIYNSLNASLQVTRSTISGTARSMAAVSTTLDCST